MPQGQSRLRMKRASAPRTHGDEDDSLDYLEHRIFRLTAPIHQVVAQYNGHRTVNYIKGKHKFENLRFEDYGGYDKEQLGDFCFWMWFHADWYENVIMPKSNPTTEMKSNNWTYLDDLDMPVVTQAVNACARMNLQPIMSYNCHWNEEVIAQFYVTLYANRGKKEFHWMLQGQRFSVTYNQFATILGFFAKDLKRPKTHDENMLEDGEMHYMHDSAYGKVMFGIVFGLIPYYMMINQLLRYTVSPKGGNSDKISNMSRILLARMAPNLVEFSVFDFIWEEIIFTSISSKKGCHYAPYLLHVHGSDRSEHFSGQEPSSLQA